MNHPSLPEVDNISDLYKYELIHEAERLGVDDQIKSSHTKDDVVEILEDYSDKQDYRAQMSRNFCKENGLRVRTDLNSQQRLNLHRIINEGKTLEKDEYGNRAGLPYDVQKV